MIDSQVDRLRRLLKSPESLIDGSAAPEEFHHDATPFSAIPTFLLKATSTDDVTTAVQFCRDEGIPITPRGAGTGLSGGCVPSRGALLLSLADLTDLEIIPSERVAICEPGVITKDLLDAAAEFSLTYPPDPASFAESTLGGNVAENAGGLRCKRFGVTKDYVLGMEIVLADGSLLQTGYFGDGSGFSLGDLFIGSEGTLGIVTRMALRLIDKPAAGDTILAAFTSQLDAANTVTGITTAGVVTSVLEFLDGDTVAMSNQYEKAEGLDNAGAILLIETGDDDRAAQTEQISALCRENNATYVRIESDPDKAENLWRVRRNLSYAAKDLAELRVSEDVAVPNSHFPRLVVFVAELNENSPLRINSFGHAGDGNLHVNFMAESDTQEARDEVDRLINILMRKAIDLGGTLTGEHGIGLAKREFIPLEFDPATLGAMLALRELFDPATLMNPDKLFPEFS